MLILFNCLPKYTKAKTRGEKPIIDEIINFSLSIFKIVKTKFWTISGKPGIILKIIKYSNVESDKYEWALDEYLL